MGSRHPLFPRPDGTALVVVDVQERLFAAMDPDRKEEALKNTILLLQLAATLHLPVLLTEQYPRGLGPTLPAVEEHLPEGTKRFEKLVFSSWRAEGFTDAWRATGASHAILAGMESHVCVLGTALDMAEEGILVHAARDAILSRTQANRRTGLELMDRGGAVISSTETLIFQLLDRAGTDDFKVMAKLVK